MFKGPSVDHTFGNTTGHYLFIETSDPRKRGDQAWLNSIVFDAADKRCFKFFYHMFGQSIGSLRVDIIYENNAKEVLWLLSKEMGDKWYEANVGINSKQMTYRLVIVGIKGDDSYGDIAIDDLSFDEATDCDLKPSQVLDELSSLTPFPTSTQPPEPSNQEITCNFDQNDICGWQNDPKAKLAWILNKGLTFALDTGNCFVVFFFNKKK